MSKNKNNLVPGTIKGIQIVDLEKKIHNKSSSKHYSIKLNKSKNSNYSNNSINNEFSMFSPKDNMSSKNASINSKTKQLKNHNNNNKSIRIKGQIMTKNHKGNIIKIKSISTQKKKNINHNHYNAGSSNNNNVSNVVSANNQSIKGNGNVNKYKIIKKIKNNIKNYKNNVNDNTRILNLKKNVKLKSYNLLNETNNNINNSNPHMTFIKKSISNQTYLESVSTKSNYNNVDVNKINNNSKILTSNNSCEDLSFNKIISIQKVKINPKNNNNNNNNKINEENTITNKKIQKRKKIEPYYNNKNSSTSNINKSFNIGKNAFYYNNNIISINSNNNNNNNSINNNNSVINNNNDLEKTKRTKKIISISCSLKNPKDGKVKMKVHRRQQSMIDQSYNNKNKKNFYQNLSNVSIKSKIRPQTVNIVLQNDSKNKNKIRNSAKKFHNKEEPMSAKKIIEKYRNYLKEYEIEELKQLSKNGEMVYYLGEILHRINNKENTFSKTNKSFILKNKNSNTKLTKGEERGFINKSCNNFREGKDEKLNEIKNKFEQNNFNDEEGDYKLNIGAHLNYRYEIIECVGKGSFGEAIKCYDHKNNDLVCVKMINSQQKFQNQAKIEIKILSAISSNDINNDSNNVKFYNYFIFREHICLVFELLGKNLYEYLQLNNFVGLDLSLIKNYTIQILFSLLFLRNINIIHCDLKPENILIFPSNPNQIKVIDFGSSCFEAERMYLYIQSRFYRAPEVILDLGYDYEIDMWSLGCILYELYTGTPLFPGINEMEQIYLIMEKLGTPPNFLIENSPKSGIFFDTNLRPFLINDEEGNIIKPGSKKIKDLLKDCPETFIDFINKCLLWNPLERLTPDKALLHPFIIENMNTPELYKHKLKVKHIKYGMQNYNKYNINSTRNKDSFNFYNYNYNKEIIKHRGNSCGTNRNNNKMPKFNNNDVIYTNTMYCEKDEIKKNSGHNYSVTHSNANANNRYNIYFQKHKKENNLPLSIDIDVCLRRINNTESNDHYFGKFKNRRNKKKFPRHLPKKKSFGRIKKNNKKIKNFYK